MLQSQGTQAMFPWCEVVCGITLKLGLIVQRLTHEVTEEDPESKVQKMCIGNIL